jgi:hypothetical protein
MPQQTATQVAPSAGEGAPPRRCSSGFTVHGLRFTVYGRGAEVEGSGVSGRNTDIGFELSPRVSGLGFRDEGLGLGFST